MDAQAVFAGPSDDAVRVRISFRLDPASNGIAPAAEPFTLDVASLSFTLPRGVFAEEASGWHYSGEVAGGTWSVRIDRSTDGSDILTGRGRALERTQRTPTIAVGLTIGDDAGIVTVKPRFVECVVPRLKGSPLRTARIALNGAKCSVGRVRTRRP